MLIIFFPENQREEKYKKSSKKSFKRTRTIFTPNQLQRLEKEFSGQQYVAGDERKQLAAELQLSETQVKVWFQNRRIRFRKQNRMLKTSETQQFSTEPVRTSDQKINSSYWHHPRSRDMSRIDRSNEKHDFITSTLKQRKQHNLET